MSILVSVPKYPSCNHHGPDLRKVRLSFNGKVRVPLRSRSTTIVSRVVSNNGIRNIITTLPIQLDEAVEKGDGSPAASVPPAVSAPGEVLSVTPSTTPGRSSFPPGFTFGAATAAYQIEGAWDTDGKGPSIWDTFTHNHPGKIAGWRDGDNGIESYTRFKEDVKALKDMGLDAYRFSISWPRILPKGSKNGGLNRDGIQYYNNLINELKENGIKPYVTLFHWDTPQALEDEYGGFRSYKIVNDFKDFVDVCFEEFGDRVRNWITLNEPFIFSSFGYGKGTHAPGRCSSRKECEEGDSLREPYIVAHNLIRAHTAAARLYKEKYQANQKGQIGITLNVHWYKPISDSYQDIEAASRAVQFMLGWFLDPLVYGDYPFCMKALVRDRLPSFTPQESELIKDSYDFIGINYNTARYAQGKQFQGQPTTNADDSYVTESRVDGDGKPIGEQSGAWINLCAEELKELLVYLKCRYNNPKIYITENGTCEVEKGDHLMLTLGSELDDPHRSKYMYLHLDKLREAIEQEGVNVHGYFAWSLLDNFEWSSGYTQRFGLTYVDHHTFQRIPKESATWFTKFLRA